MYAPTNSTIRNITPVKKPKSSLVKIIQNKGGARMPIPVDNLPSIHTLSLLSRKGVDEDEVGKVTVFDIGLTIHAPKDLNLQIVATPSLISHGYMLPNGITFVQSKIPLTIQLYKFREGPDLELPYDGLYLSSPTLNNPYYRRSEKLKPRRVESFEFEQEQVAASSVNDFQDFPPQNLNTLT